MAFFLSQVAVMLDYPMVAVESAGVLRECLGCWRCVGARGSRVYAGQLKQWITSVLWSDSRERWRCILPTLWRSFVIRSGARASAAQQRNGCFGV